MPCACIRKVFDLHIDFIGSNRIVIEDQSVWDQSTYDKPDAFNVIVKSAMRSTNKTVLLFTNKRNVFTTKDLFGTAGEECMEDEIFCFEVFSCGLTYTINRAYMPNARCKAHYLESIAKDKVDEDFVDKVNMLIESIESFARSGRLSDARDAYLILTEKLSRVTCDCGCG
jgi:hypothetical protein